MGWFSQVAIRPTGYIFLGVYLADRVVELRVGGFRELRGRWCAELFGKLRWGAAKGCPVSQHDGRSPQARHARADREPSVRRQPRSVGEVC